MLFLLSIFLCVLYASHLPSSAQPSNEPDDDSCFCKELGQSCFYNDDCAPAYSFCDSDASEGQRTCKCSQGFSEVNGQCVWKGNYVCPTNDKNITAGKSCIIVKDKTTSLSKNNCGAKEYCYVEPNTFTPAGDQVGRCCPIFKDEKRVKTLCPVGFKKSNAKCMPQGQITADDETDEACSSRTHTCSYYDNDNYACCQNPCRVWGAGNIAGRCFRGATLNRPCTHDAQCYYSGSRCYPIGKTGKKTCRCHRKSKIENQRFCSNVNPDDFNKNGPLRPRSYEFIHPR